MPIRSRITGEASRIKLKRGDKALHPLLRAGTKHHSIWVCLVQAGAKGLSAAQMKARDYNYHPQVLADLIEARLVGKLGRKASNEIVYVADPAGKGRIVQKLTIEVEVYETDKGEFVTRTVVHGKRGTTGQVSKFLGSRKITFTVPEEDEFISKVNPDTIKLDTNFGLSNAKKPTAAAVLYDAREKEADKGLLIEADYAIIDG